MSSSSPGNLFFFTTCSTTSHVTGLILNLIFFLGKAGSHAHLTTRETKDLIKRFYLDGGALRAREKHALSVDPRFLLTLTDLSLS